MRRTQRVHPPQGTGQSRVQQHHKDASNINNIVGTHLRGPMAQAGFPIGYSPNASRKPMFLDLSSVDFQTMLNKVADVRGQFDALPAKLRRRFYNDPYQMVRFVENEENRQECIKLGLLLPTEEEAQALRKAGQRPPHGPARAGDTEEDLEAQAASAGENLKADEEAQPKYNTPQKGGKKA